MAYYSQNYAGRLGSALVSVHSLASMCAELASDTYFAGF